MPPVDPILPSFDEKHSSDQRSDPGQTRPFSPRARLPNRDTIEADGLRLAGVSDPARERGLLALLASARHEVRSPLQSVQGFAELLAAEAYGPLASEQRSFVEHILQGSRDLTRALDACFDLLQAELIERAQTPMSVDVVRSLLDAIAQTGGAAQYIELDRSRLAPGVHMLVDPALFARGFSGIITALSPSARNRIAIHADQVGPDVQLVFEGIGAPHAPDVFVDLEDISRHTRSARSLLWLRLASSMMRAGSVRVESTAFYEHVRVTLPTAS